LSHGKVLSGHPPGQAEPDAQYFFKNSTTADLTKDQL